MKKQYLLTPGPTPLPPEVVAAMSRTILHHRTPQFQAILSEVNEDLKYLFQTKNEVLILASSGTGGMEAAVSNLTSPGDKAIVVRGGKFGERFGEICEVFGVKIIPIDVEWGKAVEPDLIRQKLNQEKGIKVVFTTLCETSTGVVTDLKTIGEIVKSTEAVLVVDAVSALGALDIQTDNWNLDVVVSGSQKGLMLPPGLALVSVSQKAWEMIDKSKSPRYYFDLKKAKTALQKTDTPFTPAITLIVGLRESLRMIKEVGLQNLFNRYNILAAATRAAVEALGLKLFASTDSSNALTAANVPEGIDGEKLVKLMRDKYGVTITGGQDHLKGKVIRIAHLGYIVDSDIIVAISALETALNEMGYKVKLGSGVKAAEEILLNMKYHGGK